ncbi:hypothetical protein RALTA_ACDS2467000R [Cupriavidus taiwanensis LMG 19424]|uniref:Uncharacterized protein n=1 Tax=Cupriavidus taiwanensis (strain DSM 17343 / BCRC 17206 / CCUG 44338 / CIP 107171 / LMG 19424 / R1) TaxID=977880 RepID=B3R5T9_CUPTR|nr:hypothetical protein RALTA_ACDS2467000R [Cupriavidus taiwanensis LMG 19424]
MPKPSATLAPDSCGGPTTGRLSAGPHRDAIDRNYQIPHYRGCCKVVTITLFAASRCQAFQAAARHRTRISGAGWPFRRQSGVPCPDNKPFIGGQHASGHPGSSLSIGGGTSARALTCRRRFAFATPRLPAFTSMWPCPARACLCASFAAAFAATCVAAAG